MKQQTVDPFQAIADPSRRQILHLLSKEKLTINSLAENFEMSRPAVSKHVKILNSAGLISVESAGRERLCTLKQEGFNQLHQWLEYYEKFWTMKLNALEQFLSGTQPSSRKNNKGRKAK
ncbi:MAG: metalloregulator ArsR/SmtB family transcription factor [Melioribacteraceae bacterium]|nr:metalloregulator ArsR/SmtB family transcription factor [Melioribacteraceae bacterium]MCF8353680.1 metalloregulator ArsR/SmtB family transcription factor [Melioribacteraceae bacterium]MCF8394462.1 metalloregulator ArsR/SmtB family transcription factor [Melioribacteraceae bacterium]MCF8418596.1 metalloregulator ArsR/SmtB family transcription factor [Melioribacteraceae bacterium]